MSLTQLIQQPTKYWKVTALFMQNVVCVLPVSYLTKVFKIFTRFLWLLTL